VECNASRVSRCAERERRRRKGFTFSPKRGFPAPSASYTQAKYDSPRKVCRVCKWPSVLSLSPARANASRRREERKRSRNEMGLPPFRYGPIRLKRRRHTFLSPSPSAPFYRKCRNAQILAAKSVSFPPPASFHIPERALRGKKVLLVAVGSFCGENA